LDICQVFQVTLDLLLIKQTLGDDERKFIDHLSHYLTVRLQLKCRLIAESLLIQAGWQSQFNQWTWFVSCNLFAGRTMKCITAACFM